MSDLSTNASLRDAIKRYGMGQQPEPDIAPEAAPVEETYTPPAFDLAALGAVRFKDVFDWAPDAAPEIPVKVFKDEDWPAEIRPFIPASLPNGGAWIWPHKATEQLMLAMWAGDRALLKGPTGSGKTELITAVCFMCRIPVMRTNCHAQQQATDFLGKDIIVTDPASNTPVLRYDYTVCTNACRFGGFFVADEGFRSPVLMAIQSLLERNGTLTLPDAASLTPEQRRLVPPAGKFWLAITDNTNGTGDESGAYNAEIQDISTLDRITATIDVDYVTPRDEMRLLAKQVPGLPPHIYKDIAEWAAQIRAAFLAGTIMQPISLRATGSILRKYAISGNLAGAIELAYLAKLSAPQAHAAREAYAQVTSKELS